ncbi:MAG: TonB-dependent receptor [Croceibacterium sp.]
MNTIKLNRRTRLLACTALWPLSLGLATQAAAQVAQPIDQTPSAQRGEPAAATSDKPAEEIVVTGSRIRGVEAVGSSVIAIDQTKIAETPVQSTAELLRRVPQIVTLGANPNGGSAQNGAANATRSSGINLRGIGIGATLLLYDGKRLPPQGTQGQLTDPSVIPSIALARVEVVADGASAIYGSDAIAGVVNFILRKNFDGAEFSARSSFTGDGAYDEQQLSGIVGKRWNGGWGMLTAEYTRNSPLYASALSWYQANNLAKGGRDLRGNFCDPGTITVGGGTYAIPAGGATAANVGSLVRGTVNRCFYNGEGNTDAVIPEAERKSVVGSMSQEIGSRIRVFADGFYGRRDGVIPSIATATAVVPRTNPFFVTPMPGATSVSVTWSPVQQYGPLVNPFHSYSWNASAGVEARLIGDIKGTFYYAHGESRDVADRRQNGINAAALTAALADTNPATALNVFGGPNNRATLDRLFDNLFVIVGATKLDVANLQFDGSLATLPGGNLRFAVGGEYRREYTFTDLVTGTNTTEKHVADSGSRNVKAAFGELYVPLFGPANARPGLEELSLSLAGRWERYSNFGETSNPKVGVTYQPVRGVKLRATYGTSFRAPTFTEVSTIAGGAGLYFDTLPGPSGANLTGIGIAGGNPDLKPETAKTWSAGIQLRPLSGLSAELTYFNIAYKNQIQALRGTAGLLTSPLYTALRNLAPTPAEIATLRTSGLPINNPNVLTGTVQFIADGRRQNLGESKVSGLDFLVGYDWEWGDWRLDTGVNGSYYLTYDFQAVPGSGFTDVRNTIGFPQKFHMQADAGVAHGPFRARATFNHLSGYRNNTVAPVQVVEAYDTVDLFLGYDVTEHATVSFQVRNLFDRDPPFVDAATGYDPQSANPVPRLFMVNARIKT